jgi:hypothetical protein
LYVLFVAYKKKLRIRELIYLLHQFVKRGGKNASGASGASSASSASGASDPRKHRSPSRWVITQGEGQQQPKKYD